MKLIFISGPSGSGKTTLSNKILERNENGIVLSTDNYYKTGLRSILLSKLLHGYFDRNISFNNDLLLKDFNFILKNKFSIHERFYNFKTKTIENLLKERNNIEYLIIEGIFAREFTNNLFSDKYFLLELKTNKNECMYRAVQRDLKERGKKKKQAESDFLKSWAIYSKKLINKSIKFNSNEIFITKNTDIDQIIKKIFN